MGRGVFGMSCPVSFGAKLNMLTLLRIVYA